MLENLPTSTLARLLRRTTVSAVLVGAGATIVALAVAPPLAAVGVVAGVVLALANLRLLDRQAARVEVSGEQRRRAVRRQIGGRTAGRLALITLIVLGLLWLSVPLGLGIVSGLVLYQVVFVLNVLRVVARQGGPE